MRAILIAMVLLSVAAAPVVAAWPDDCGHEAPVMAEGADHDMHEAMSMDVDAGTESSCHCDLGCAEHCDAAAPAALLGIDSSDQPIPASTSVIAAVRSFEAGPPRAAPLRPPQTRS